MEFLIILFFGLCGFAWFKFGRKSAPPLRSKVEAISEWEKKLSCLKRADGEMIEFTYESKDGRQRRRVTLREILQHDNGVIYLKGFCHIAQEDRTFNTNKICTMVKVGSKRMDVDRYLEEKYSVG